jgi:hypothetical protein
VNWAIFEPPAATELDLARASADEIKPDDADLLAALRLLNLTLA